MSRAPSSTEAVGKYRQSAEAYDRRTRRIARYRQQAVERLLLWSGDTVVDVACGTGVNFPLLEQYVGRRGRVIGIDVSPDMLSRARDRVERHGWSNVVLLEARAEDADIPGPADAALFSLSHDVLRSKAALDNVLGQLGPGARVASFGAKWAPWWALPVNLCVWLAARRYVTTFDGFSQPWDLLGRRIGDLQVESVALGGAYVASGATGRPD